MDPASFEDLNPYNQAIIERLPTMILIQLGKLGLFLLENLCVVCVLDSFLRFPEWEFERPRQAHQSGGKWRQKIYTKGLKAN